MKTLSRLMFVFAVALAAALPAAAAERTIELRVDGSQAVTVHNLVGAVRLVPGEGDFVIRATVSADKQAVADAVQLRRSNVPNGVEVAVDYPADISHIRYDGQEIRRIDALVLDAVP